MNEPLWIRPKAGKKGRSFAATLLAYATADALWPGGETGGDKTTRPVWIMYAAGEGEVRPFTANLRLGRAAEIPEGASYSRRKSPSVELLKSAGYAFSTQRFAEGSVVTAYLPDLVRLDPGMVDPSGIRFVMLPPRSWVEAQGIDAELAVSHARACGMIDVGGDRYRDRPELPSEDEVRRLALLAPAFAAYLDRRTRAPLVADFRFYVQILIASLARGLAAVSSEGGYRSDHKFGQHSRLGFLEHEVEGVGLVPGLAMCAGHVDVETMLAEQAAIYFGRI